MRALLPAVAAAVLAAGVALAAPVAFAATHTVVIENFAFKPQTLHVKAGDTVRWENKDIVDHTATAKDGAFDSKDIQSGASWTWKAGKTGQHPYICTVHPFMTGVIDVE
jgi:plastocyanin